MVAFAENCAVNNVAILFCMYPVGVSVCVRLNSFPYRPHVVLRSNLHKVILHSILNDHIEIRVLDRPFAPTGIDCLKASYDETL